MGQLKNVVRLSETDYSTLLNGGSVTKGGKTYTLDANTLYVVEDETPPSYAQRSDYASEAGRAHGADCASHDADGNNIVDTYATKDDVDAELSEKADKSATVSTVGYDATNKKLTKTINGTTSDVVTASTIVTDGGGYKKPSTGIPKTDLASAVQTSLGKADTALQSHQDISGKANLASPTFTGTPKAPTAAAGTNTTQIATTAFVQSAVADKSKVTVNQPTSGSGTGTQVTVDGTAYQVVSDSDPGTTNGVDYQQAPTWHQVRTQLAAKADKSATVSTVGYDATNKKLTKTINGTTSDVVTASTVVTDGGGYKKPSTGIPKTDLASAVQTSLDKADTALQSHQDISGKANLASPTFTGTPKAPTAAAGTNTTQIATTAFVQNAVEAKSMMITAAENAHSDTAGQRVIPFSSPSDMAGIYGAILQWTAQPNRLPSDGNPSWYFQLLARHSGELYFRSRINGANWSSFLRLTFRRDLDGYAKTSDLPGDASTSQKGIVQLSGTINSDNAKAATPAAVYDALTSFAQQAQSRINEAVAGKSAVEVSQSSDGTMLTVDDADYTLVSEQEPTGNANQMIAPSWDAMKSAMNAKANLASPTFTGTPKAPTAAAGTNTTQIATTAFVQAAVNKRLAQYHFGYPENSDNAQRWKKIGSYTTGGDGSAFVIEIFGGNGYNANWYQNTAVRIMIKDGYQTTKAAAESVGITVEKFITDNVDYEVAVVASSDTQGDVWLKVNTTYTRYEYMVYGNFASWTHNSSFAAADFTTTAPSHNQKKVEYIDYLKGQAITTWVSRNNFTEAQWATYAATAHEEGWAATLKHGLKKGDYFAVTGQATDTKNYHTAIYRCDEPGGSGVNPHGKCIRHYNASAPEDAFGLTFRLALNTHVFQSGVTDTGNNFISITALMCDGASVETLYSAGKIVIKDATGTVRSTWTNKCYATFSGSGFNTFASYSGPFTVELQNASGTVLTSTQIVKV